MNKKAISKFVQKNVLNKNMTNLEKAGKFLFLEKEILKGKVGFISFGALVVYEYIKGKKNTVKAKSRLTKEPTPENLHTIYKLVFKITTICLDYAKRVNKLFVDAGLEPDFEPKETYTLRYEDSLIVLYHKDDIEKEDMRMYIRIYDDMCKGKPQCIYFDKNFNLISKEDIPKIKDEYLPLPKKDELVKPRNHKMQHVIYAKYGEFKIEDAPIEDLKQLVIDTIKK